MLTSVLPSVVDVMKPATGKETSSGSKRTYGKLTIDRAKADT